MATIANLTKKDGGFTGTLILPSLNGMKETLRAPRVVLTERTDDGANYILEKI